MRKRPSKESDSPSDLIDARIAELGDWRGEMLARLRAVIKDADPGVAEEWKWDKPVWSHDGLICTGETYKKVVKTTFARAHAQPVIVGGRPPQRRGLARQRAQPANARRGPAALAWPGTGGRPSTDPIPGG
jgi:hypothetical protein